MKNVATKKELLKYLNTPQGRKAFDDHCGAPNRTPETYLDEYAYRRGIVHDLAMDTGFYKYRDGKEYYE